jgi:hypothetical protein
LFTLDLQREPVGDAYRRLLQALAPLVTTAKLVVRDTLDGPEVQRCLVTLSPWIVARERASSWPGTQLIGHTAELITLTASAECLETLGHLVDGLLGWCHAAAPEDLSLYRPDGTFLLGSIAHEHDAFLELSREEFVALLASFPPLEEHFDQTGPRTRLDWGDEVRIAAGAPAAARPGSHAHIMAMTRVVDEHLASTWSVLPGTIVYTVEFSDGTDAQVADTWLEPLDEPTST